MADNNKVVTVSEYLDLWYQKSGQDDNFKAHIGDFKEEFNLWSSATSASMTNDRCLWHDSSTYNGNVIENQFKDIFYKSDIPVLSLSEQFYVTNTNATVNKLITHGELDNFQLIKVGANGTLYVPETASSGAMPYNSVEISLRLLNENSGGWYQNIEYNIYPNTGTPTYNTTKGMYYINTQNSDVINDIFLTVKYTINNTNVTIPMNQQGALITLSFDSNKSLELPITTILPAISPRTFTINASLTGQSANSLKLADYAMIKNIDMENISFIISTPDQYVTFDWMAYTLFVGTNRNLALTSGIIPDYDNTYVDIISEDGNSVYATVDADPTLSDRRAYNLNITQIYNKLGGNKTAYIRGHFVNSNNSSQKLILCFRASFSDSSITPNTSDNNACSVWLNTNAKIFVKGQSGKTIYIYPNNVNNKQFTITQSGINFGSTTNYQTFSTMALHQTGTFNVTWENYAILASTEAELQSYELFSLISSRCTTIGLVFNAFNNSNNEPTVSISYSA